MTQEALNTSDDEIGISQNGRKALAAARGLADLITGLRHQTEADRRVAAPIVDAMIDANLFRMPITPDLGGLGLSTVDALHVFEALSGLEASVSWVAWNNSLPWLYGRFLSPDARAEIFTNPTWLHANSTRPSGKAVAEKDGYRITGQWSLVSGCELAEWMPLACLVEDDGELRMAAPGVPELRFAFLRKGQYEIIDTWNVGGLRGTGSHDVAVREVLVPAEFTLFPGDPPTLDDPMGRVPINATLAGGFAAQALGIAQSSIDALIHMAQTKITPGPVPDLRDRSRARVQVASCTAAVNAARTYLYQAVGEGWDKAVAGNPWTNEDIAKVLGAEQHANEVARNTVDEMFTAGGTSAMYTDNPLERAHRDIHAMMRHVLAQPILNDQSGRVLFGLEPNDSQFGL
jgi:indole-3-acetate monooxygenase